MGNISITTNIDPQNYSQRISKIVKYMNPLGIEIFSMPQNYPNTYSLELMDKQDSTGPFALLSKKLAKDIGRELGKCGLHRIQFHYPWQKTLLDLGGQDLALTIKFCDIMLEESKADQLTINYHNVLKYPTPSFVTRLGADDRKNVMKKLELDTKYARWIKEDLKSPCLLIVENNPAVSIDFDKKTNEGLLDNVDLVPEDYIERMIDGTTLDYSHAWTVVNALKDTKGYVNLEWCINQYEGIPQSAISLENFVKKVAPKTKWIHLSDDTQTYTHSGFHIGKGATDFKECARLLSKYLTEEIVATIEVKGGHSDEGLKEIIEWDFPYLSRI